MSDYISREAALELLTMALEDDWETGYAADRMMEMPAIDAVPVVRCRECVHWATGTNEEESWEYCTLLDHEIDGDRFCAYGERKDGGADNG